MYNICDETIINMFKVLNNCRLPHIQIIKCLSKRYAENLILYNKKCTDIDYKDNWNGTAFICDGDLYIAIYSKLCFEEYVLTLIHELKHIMDIINIGIEYSESLYNSNDLSSILEFRAKYIEIKIGYRLLDANKINDFALELINKYSVNELIESLSTDKRFLCGILGICKAFKEYNKQNYASVDRLLSVFNDLFSKLDNHCNEYCYNKLSMIKL